MKKKQLKKKPSQKQTQLKEKDLRRIAGGSLGLRQRTDLRIIDGKDRTY